MNSKTLEALAIRINAILLQEWDPLGVNRYPEAIDEYNSYARKISEMLIHGRDAFSIGDYLRQLESGMMSAPASETRIQRVVGLVLREREGS